MARKTIKMGYSGKTYETGYTGGVAESELVGEIRDRRILLPEEAYLPYRDSIQFCRDHCPYNPTDPDPRWANDVHATVAQMLEVEYQMIEFYTGRQTPLDYKHGVDAFIELKLKNGKKVTVTIDITTRPKGSYKANITVLIPREGIDPKDDFKDFRANVEKVSKEVVKLLQDAQNKDISYINLYID